MIRLPRRTVRLRLTVMYGALFLVSGAVLLTVTNVLVRADPPRLPTEKPLTISRALGFVQVAKSAPLQHLFATFKAAPPNGTSRLVTVNGGPVVATGFETPGGLIALSLKQAQTAAAHYVAITVNQAQSAARYVVSQNVLQQNRDNHALLVWSIVAFAVMAILSLGLGWLISGRVLRPLRTITATANAISAHNLHERLDLHGPNDELKDLADTFDRLLGRLEGTFESQRRFVANASHELRSPLTRQRTLAEVALSDPDPTIGSLRASHERLIAAGEQQEHLIEALLTLARSERGLDRSDPADLAVIAGRVVAARGDKAREHHLTWRTTFDPATTTGDPVLLERLVANLVDNALVHNIPGGFVEVKTGDSATTGTVLSVENTGAVVGEVDQILEPFRRAGRDRTGASEGSGLGLSIVAAIASAHGAALDVAARPEGGLVVTVTFPPHDGTQASVPSDR